MVDRLESEIDALDERFDPPKGFTVPGGNVPPRGSTSPAPSCAAPSATPLTAAPAPSLVGPYLNRLSDLLWTMARWQDAVDGSTLRARDVDAGGQT